MSINSVPENLNVSLTDRQVERMARLSRTVFNLFHNEKAYEARCNVSVEGWKFTVACIENRMERFEGTFYPGKNELEMDDGDENAFLAFLDSYSDPSEQ